MSSKLDGQCIIQGNFPIPDNGETSIAINVSGLVQPDLGDPGQGLCGVRIRFRHDLIGDLLISLSSPSGQIIQLTGPTSTTSSTDLTVWDVTFVPCIQSAMPDPGFTDQWDNDQFWAVLANYSGSYYPYSGCLEDFTGSAVGLWTLIIEDSQQLDIGRIERVELIFCDSSGQNCSECMADGGLLPIDTVDQCVNETPVEFNIEPVFPDGEPGSEYTYVYVISYNGLIIDVNTEFDNNGLDTGIYTVCGLSVLASDTALVMAFPPNLDVDEFQSWLLSNHICFDFKTNDCAVLRVKPELPPFFESRVICQGEELLWRGQIFTQTGDYQVINIGANGCLREHNLNLTVLDPEPLITELVSFGCGQEIARLQGTDLTFGTDVDFFWYANPGTILSNPNDTIIDVSESGVYNLVTTRNFGVNGSCQDTTSISLINDFEEPQISYLGTTIDCNVDSSIVRSLSTLPNATIIWRNALGVEDTARNHVIYWGEEYTLIAVSEQGCRDSLIVVLPYDTISPSIIISDIPKPCLNDSVLLTPGIPDPNWTYMWVDPDGDSFMSAEIYSDKIGVFTLYVTSENGCTAELPVEVIHSGPTPLFQILSDTFFCFTDSIHISVTSNLMETSFLIDGRQGFNSTEHDVYVGLPGNYTVTVETVNGCTYDTVWQTPWVRAAEMLNIIGDTLDCETDSVILFLDILGNSSEYSWQGPGDFYSEDDSVIVRESGTYELELRTKNGCRIIGSYEVITDTLKPSVSIAVGVIDCNSDSVRFQVMADEDTYQYDWVGPNSFQSNMESPWTTELGWHYVTVTDDNACRSFFSVEVLSDFGLPGYSIDASSVTCIESTSDVVLTSSAAMVEWNGPGFMSNDRSVTLPELNTYNLILTGSNGCRTMVEYVPPVDTARAVLELFTDILGCHRDTVPLYYLSGLEIMDLVWMGSDVHDTSADTTSTSMPGLYSIRATALNGCESEASIFVTEDFTIPMATINGTDTVNCLIDTVSLSAQSTSNGLTYLWTLPDLSSHTDTFLISLLSGYYILTIEAPNSCRDTILYHVYPDTALPLLSLQADTINCVRDEATVLSNLNQDDQVTWTLPTMSTSNQPTIMTTTPGIYKAVVLNTRSGCVDSSEIEVIIDTAQIENEITGDEEINCMNNRARLNSAVYANAASLNWWGPNFIAVDVDEVFVVEPGTYYLQSSLPSQCFDLDSFTVVLDTVAPVLELFGDTLKCSEPKVSLSFVSSSSDISYAWSGPMGFNSTDSMPFVNIGGYYVIEVTINSNGCSARDSILIVGDTLSPTVMVDAELFSCEDTTAAISAVTVDEVDQFLWLGPGGFSAMGQDFIADRTGEYTLFAFAENGCVGIDTFILNTFDEIDDAELSVDSISCFHPMATHNISTTEPDALFSWYEGPNLIGNSNSFTSGFGGSIRVVIENNRGCQWDSTFSVLIDSLAPNPAIVSIGEIICDNREIELIANNLDTSQPLVYNWMTSNGQILSGDNTEMVVIGAPGDYGLHVMNTRNGCFGDDVITIEESADSLEIGASLIVQPNCNNGYEGSVEVIDVRGGIGTISYFLDGIGPGFDPLFQPLDPGMHVVTVKDMLGCYESDTIVIDDVIIRFVDIERDTVIQLGSPLHIEPFHNLIEGSIETKIWTIDGELICDGCDSLYFQPTISGYYALTIQDEDDCIVSDSILVHVISVPRLYIPDAFSPNRDGINDEIGPYFGNNVVTVHEFSIYSRWGERLHHRLGLNPDDPILFWNGRKDGELLSPGVFIYTIMIELIDGQVITRKGEFLLIR